MSWHNGEYEEYRDWLGADDHAYLAHRADMKAHENDKHENSKVKYKNPYDPHAPVHTTPIRTYDVEEVEISEKLQEI